MKLGRRALIASSAAVAVPRRGRAQGAKKTIKIGVLNDMSGPYRDSTGMGSVACAQQAVRQFNSAGFDVQILAADHQNKPDIGAGIVRQWIDRDGIDMILDVPTSSVALAVNSIAREKNILYVNTGAGTGDLTGSQCTPVTIHWGYDTYALARSTATQVTKLGGKKWYMITADYVFGQQLARDGSRFAREAGAEIIGEQRYPFPQTTDFSSFLLSAQSSGADVVGLANAGDDTSNCVKQAHEFGLNKSMKIAALLVQITDIQAMGTEIAAGLYLTATFYWDSNEKTRALTAAVQPGMPDKTPPNMIQVACYAGTLHYLKALTALGVEHSRDGAAVCAQMKAMPTEDEAFGSNHIRKDGLCTLPTMLYQVKSSAESHGKWDLQKLVATTPGDQAWKSLAEEGCALAPA